MKGVWATPHYAKGGTNAGEVVPTSHITNVLYYHIKSRNSIAPADTRLPLSNQRIGKGIRAIL
jgi:hypothetical protein